MIYHSKLKRCLCLTFQTPVSNSFSGLFGGNKKSKSKPSGSSYPKQEYKPATGTGVSGGSKSGGSSYPKQEYKPSGTSGGSRCGHWRIFSVLKHHCFPGGQIGDPRLARTFFPINPTSDSIVLDILLAFWAYRVHSMHWSLIVKKQQRRIELVTRRGWQ